MSNNTESNENIQGGFIYYESTSETTKGDEMQEELITGYQVHKMANKALESAGVATIRPQMVYNYMKQRLIKVDAASGRVRREDAMKWIEKYVAAKKSRENV